jgi:hypothetical protein
MMEFTGNIKDWLAEIKIFEVNIKSFESPTRRIKDQLLFAGLFN